MISKIAASFLRPDLGVRFASATLAVAIVVATLPAGIVEAAATTHIERIKGTVGFLSSMSAPQNTVETYAYVPDGDMARAGCSSMAALTFQSGASVMLGGSTVLRTPQDGKPALLSSGAVAYRSNVPFTLATSLGSVSVRRGTGYVVAGKSAVEVIAVASDESDVSFSDPSGNVYKIAGGKALTQTGPTDGGRLGPAMIQDVSAVNNPAIDQFAQGRNPLGHTSVAAFDPTGSPKATCGGIARTAAGLAAGPLVALLVGGGAVAAVALGGQSGGGGNGSGGGGGGGGRSPGGTPSSGVPTTGPSGSPSSGPVGSPTPNPGGSPSSRPSGSPSGAPSSRPSGAPSSSPSGSPSGAPSGSPSGAPSGSPSGAPSGSPSGAPSGSPSGAPSASPSASAAPVYGAVTLAPNAVLVSPALGAQASSTIAVSQSGYTGGYTASVSGCVGVGTPPTATVVSTGPGMANVVVTATGTVNLNLGCQVTVTGGNGMTAIAPVTVTLAAGGTPTPSPSPTASSAASPGPVVVNPTSILLSPAVGSAATTTVTATQVNGGPFTATVTSCVGAGTPPVAAVTNTGNGMATVTVTASGVVGAQIGCNLVITGAGMQSTTVPLTVSAVVIGPSPTPVPSPTGTGLGTLRVNPTSVLLQPSALGANASANILVGQANYTGSFGATLRCPVALNQPMVSVSGTGVAGQGVVTVTVGGPVNAAVACNVIITGGGGQSVSVPVTVAATVGVGATPTPNPNGTGPLTANPATILLNPGVATTATQNVVLSDPGYAGPYGATVTCATSGLTPILAAAFVTPTVTVTGDVVTVMSPAQPLGLSVLCTVTASSNIGQSVAIPVTVSVGVLSALDRHRRLAASSSVLFTPATVSLSAAGSAAVGSFAVSGAPGPYRVTSACLGGLGLRAIVLGNRVELEERGATALGGTCLLTVTASTGATGQIPVRTSAGAGIPTLLTSEPAHRISLARTSLTLRAGEMQSIAASGSGPFTIAGCAAVVDVRSSAGALLITGRSPGVCSLTVRGSGGGSAIVTVTVVPGVSLPARMQPRR